MTISLAQMFFTGLGNGVGTVIGAIATFVVMRYFPKFWVFIEELIKKAITFGVKTK
jgi:hypothetical protein